MKVLLFGLGSHGDVHPFVGIGIRLRQRGHRVTVASNAYFRPLIEQAGLEFAELGTADEYHALATDPDLWHPRRAAKVIFDGTARYARPAYELSRDFARQHADGVVVASTLALGARVAQDRHELPLATVHLAPSIFQSAHEPPEVVGLHLLPRWTPLMVKRGIWWAINRFLDRFIAPPLNALRAELDLPPVANVLRDYWHAPGLTIGMFPPWFAAVQPDWPRQLRLTGFPLYDEPEVTPISPQLESFLRAGEPPIAFTPGSAMWQGRAFFESAVDACTRLNRRGLLLTRHADHLPTALPPGVMHVSYAPFSLLLPQCAAVVHHGGIGSTAQSLAAGVPQLVVPFSHDQPDNGARVRRLGCGQMIWSSRFTGRRAAGALRELIDSPTVARACTEIKSRFAGVDALGQTCDLIESLAPHSAESTRSMAASV